MEMISGVRNRTTAYNPRYMDIAAASLSSVVGTACFLIFYYATLGVVPAAASFPRQGAPLTAWLGRFDISLFFGTILIPPWPTRLAWYLGLLALSVLLISAGLFYALLLSWAVQGSSAMRGCAWGGIIFIPIVFAIALGNGYAPAVMRNAIPDTGVFLFGWTGWATLQLFASFLVFGMAVGITYRRTARNR